jgi:hypothetical protein
MKASVGVLARFQVRPGSDEEMAAFFRAGLPIVQAQPRSTMWFGFRIDEETYGAFAVFASAADREALLATGGPVLVREYPHLFTAPLSFQLVDVIEQRTECS